METFPIQGGLRVPMWAAERAYKTYQQCFSNQQSLPRLGERGGFAMMEFCLLYDGKNPAGYDIQSRAPQLSRLIARVVAEIFEAGQ